jgi:hypothetical protein
MPIHTRLLSTVTDTELAKIERLVDTRLRKRLGYKTPLEKFTGSLNRVALVREASVTWIMRLLIKARRISARRLPPKKSKC